MRTTIKKTVSILLTLAMLLSVFAGLHVLPAAQAAGTGKAIELVTNGAAENILGAQQSNIWFGSYKQSSDGNSGYNVEPVKWRVLSNADGKLFLLADQNLDVLRYNESRNPVTWETCTLRKWLNDYEGNPYEDSFIGSAFSDGETAAVAQTTVVNDKNRQYQTPGGNATTDRLFLLSFAEATNTAYGFTDHFVDTDARVSRNTAYVASGGHTGDRMNAVGKTGLWWLRSPGEGFDFALIVSHEGHLSVDGGYVDMSIVAVRPALNVDLNSILFTSAAVGGKQSAEDGTLSPVGDYSGSEWKLTVLDADRSDFTASFDSASGDVWTFNYGGAKTGDNEYISAVIVDGDGAVTYYGRLCKAQSGNNNTVTVDVSSKMNEGDKLYVFNEQYNGDKKTDCASALVDVTENSITTYDLWVGGVQVTSENAGDVLGDGGSVKFEITEDGENVLTLNNAKIAGIEIRNNWALTIKLIGENEISGTEQGIAWYSKETTDNQLTLTGGGKLKVEGINKGIDVYANLLIDGVSVSATDSDYYDNGIFCFDLEIKNSIVTANGRIGLWIGGSLKVTDSQVFAAGTLFSVESNKSLTIGGDSTVTLEGTIFVSAPATLNDGVILLSPSGASWGKTGTGYTLNEADGTTRVKKAVFKKLYKVGDTLQYGTYPQNEVKDAATVTALNAKLKDGGWISYGYYIGTGGSNGEMAPGDFMRYQDVVLDGVKYRAVTFDCYRPALTTSSSSADNSFQAENGYEPGNTYWFRFEPVTWKVLDPDSGFVLCCSAIDSQAYHNYVKRYNDENWGDAEQKNRANDYAHSSIRAWLNEDFINTAFSAAQQENITVSELDNSLAYSSSDTYVYASTSDKIFLPSVSDVTAYGFDSDRDALDEARRRAPSDYAKCQGIIENSTKTAFWWLRTPRSSAGDKVCIINALGGGSSNTLTNDTANGVVPALRMQELKDDPTGAPLKVAPEMTLTAEPVTYGEDAVITAALPADADGSVTFTLTGSSNNYSFTDDSITDGAAQITQKLNADTYAVTASYSGDGKYAAATAPTTLTVNMAQLDYTIAFSPETPKAGETVQITVVIAEGTTLTVNGAVLEIDGQYVDQVDHSDSNVVFTVNNLTAGDHTVKITPSGDANHVAVAKSVTLTVACAHVWNTPTWDWTDVDNPTYSTTCTLCSDGQASGSVSSTKGERVAATVEADAYTPYSATVTLDGQTFNDMFHLTEPGTMLAARKTVFDAYKDELKQAADDKRKDGDSAASQKLIDDAVAAIDATEYDETKSLDENKQALDAAAKLDDLADDLADQRAADEVKKKIDDIGTVALTDESKRKTDEARESFDNLTDDQKALVDNKDTLETAEDAYQLLEDKADFEQYKEEQKQAAEDKRRDGDSAASQKLIDDAIAAIDAQQYDENKTLDDNKQALDAAAKLNDLADDLTDQRAADEVKKKIDDIGTVALTDESKQKIDEAREAYDNLTDDQKALVDNKDTLETAEDAYQLLEDKDSFEQYKDELKQAAEDKRKEDDSDESKALIEKAKEDIAAQTYDDNKTLDENKNVVDDIVNRLKADLAEHREIHYAVFLVEGNEVARVPYTIDTKSITEPAVPDKPHYDGAWEPYTLAPGGVEINAVYTYSGTPTVKPVGFGSEVTLSYKQSMTFDFEASDLPDGATVRVFVNGEDRGEGTSVTVDEPTEDYTVEAKAYDADGNEIAASGEIKVTVKNGFFDKLLYFFRNFSKIISKFFLDLLASAC